MNQDDQERSESGNPIYRHEPSQKGFVPAAGDSEAIQQIEQHIEMHIGKPSMVWHEIVSHLVHIDIHMVSPTPERNYYTLVTSGMSSQPMKTPEGAEAFRYAELMICLPPNWPLTQADFQDERNYWPLRWLKVLARLPHEYDTWIWASHTVPNGDPPKPFAPNTRLSGVILMQPSLMFSDAFIELKINDEKTVYFLSVMPLYREEMDFKLKNSAGSLLNDLAEAGVTEVLDIDRPNVVE
ncbi:MAG: suppressor of fused domain protein [Chloroflexota bacterium]